MFSFFKKPKPTPPKTENLSHHIIVTAIINVEGMPESLAKQVLEKAHEKTGNALCDQAWEVNDPRIDELSLRVRVMSALVGKEHGQQR